jgi:hypothetical protein
MPDKTFELAEAFLKEYKKYAPYPLYSLRKVRNTKWWKIFEKIVAKLGSDEYWNPREYVKFVFEQRGKVYPFVLASWDVWNEYKNYYIGRKESSKDIAQTIAATLREIRQWCRRNGYKSLNIEAFFNDQKNIQFVKRGKYSKYFLAISKSFREYYQYLTKEEKYEIIKPEELSAKWRAVVDDERLNEKMKEVLGEEYYEKNS